MAQPAPSRAHPSTRPRLRAVKSPPPPAQAPAGYRYSECRSLGHEWRHKGIIGGDHKTHRPPFSMSTGVVGYLSQCTDCKAERVKWITRSGEVISRYDHPDGYSRHGDERLTSREWRSSFVASVFEQWDGQA